MRTMKHWALAVSAAAALALTGCGGGGSGGTASAPAARMDVTMPADTPADYAALPGTYEIAAGGSMDVNGVRFSCTGSPCTVYVGNDGTVTSRGGMVTTAHTPLLAALLQSQSDLEDTQGRLDTANQDLIDKQGELDDANGEVIRLGGELDDANDEVTRLGGELDNANDDLDARQAEVDRLIGNQDVEAIRAKAMADRTVAEQQLLDAVDARDSAQNNVDMLTTDLETEQGKVSQLTTDLETEQGKVSQLTTERDNLQGQVTTLTTQLAAAHTVNGLFATAQTSRADADMAVTDAGDAVDNAVKYAGMLDVASVKGNSTMAAANAQKVLDAQEDAAQAVRNAEAAQTAAEGALTSAEALDDSATKTGLVAALKAAVEHAKAQVTAAKSARDNSPVDDADPPVATVAVDSLAEAVAAVTGGKDADPQTTPKTIGDRVAMAVGMALLPTNTTEGSLDGNAMRVEHYANVSDLNGATGLPAIKDRTFHMNDSEGRTWEMIVGGAVATKAISLGTGISALTEVKATPISMTVGFATDPNNVPAAGTNAVLGLELDQGATHMGIPGFVFCGGADCSQNADGDLTGSWYFRPGSTTDLYVSNPDATARTATPYVEDTTFTQWGHWLAVDGDGDVTVHTYATTGANVLNLNVGVAAGCDPECSASYSGSAAGMSLHKTFDGDNNQLTINSGAFTADVSLTARFGSAPMLSGMVTNFQGGYHTDSKWEVELKNAAIDTTSAAVTGGVAQGTGGQAGTWAAQGYGPVQTPANTDVTPNIPAVDHRPDGFFGWFETHFSDGHAAGVLVAD